MLTTADGDLGAATWIDLLDPTDAESVAVSAATGLAVPRLHDLSEIETTSRLRRDGRTLTLSVPTVATDIGGRPAPVGYVLTPDRLLTVRFGSIPSFEERLAAVRHHPATATTHFVALLEAVVDHLADLLERQAAALDALQDEVFRPPASRARKAQADVRLRGVLAGVGEAGTLLGRLRDTLLGLSRAVPYVLAQADGWLSPEAHERLASLRTDLQSLSEYDARLAEKVQFLLDATLGFINIEQNATIKLLTIVSIVGIPPTFIASLYGMNFHDIPELGWRYGYPYALALMVVTAVAPLIWFRAKGWL